MDIRVTHSSKYLYPVSSVLEDFIFQRFDTGTLNILMLLVLNWLMARNVELTASPVCSFLLG